MATAASPVETNIITTSTTTPTDPTESTLSIKQTSFLSQPLVVVSNNEQQQEDQEVSQQQRGLESQQVTQSPESDSGKSSSCSPALCDCSFDSGIAVMDMDSTSLHNAQIKKRLQQCKRILLVLNRDQEVYRLLRDRLSKISDRKKARKDADDEQICIVCCAEINASDPKSYATCRMCNKRICRNNIKCGHWLPSNAQWECELCHSSKESLAQTSSWVAEQMSFNRQKIVYPMRARSEIYIPINDCNDSSMHFESVSQIGNNLAGISAEEKIKIREYVEELVANMLGGSLDQIQVGQKSKSENYLPAILNNGHSANNTINNNNNNNSKSNNNNINGSQNGDEPALIDISQTRLRQLIETIISETLRSGVNNLTNNGAVSEITLDTRSNGDLNVLGNGGNKRRHRTEHYFEPKIYQDLLATAVLNKISDKEGNTRLFSESTPDLSARNIDENYNVEALSTTSGSSIEPRSDCSLTDHELVLNSDKIDSHTSLEASLDRESVLNDYIAAHMVPLPDISASVTESEDDIASMTSSMIGEGTWEDNWLFKKKRSGLPSSTTSSSMLVPAPKENVRAQIGDKTADEVSDLSEMGSDTDDSSLDLMRCNELNDRLLNKHLIGGHNTKLVLDELVDRSSMTSATLPLENEIPIADTKNSLVIDSVMKTEAINGNITNGNEVKAEDSILPAPPPMNFQDESKGNEIQNPIADPIESDESIESIQSEGCVGYSLFEYIEDDNANENISHENIRAHIPSVIEILAAIALGPMLAVPASEREGVMSHNELNTLKELSDLALAEINARTTDLHHSLDVIEEESSEKDMSLNIVDAQCDLLSQDILSSEFNITNTDILEIDETTLQSFDPIPPPPIVSTELQPDLSSIYLEGIPPPNEELEELKSLENMTFEAPLDFTSSSSTEEVTIAPIMEVLSTATENVIDTICTPENHCCDYDDANIPSPGKSVAIVDALNNPTVANDSLIDSLTTIAETRDTSTVVMAESVPMVEHTTEPSTANSTPTTTELAAVSTEPTNNPCEVPSEVAATEAIVHPPEIANAPVHSEAIEKQNNVATETTPIKNNPTEAIKETATDIPSTHKVGDNEIASVVTEATSEVAATEVSEGTVPASEVATERVPMEEPICELPKALQNQPEDSTEPAVVISAEENPTESISDSVAVIEQPTATLNDVSTDPVITETTITPSEIPGEPIPKVEASSELPQTSDTVTEICSESEPVHVGEVDNTIEIQAEIIIVSENTLTPSGEGTDLNPILEAAPETSAASEISKEVSSERTDISSEIVAVSVDTVIAQLEATLSEVSAEPVILETTIIPSEDTVNPEVPEPTVNPISETPGTSTEVSTEPAEKTTEPADTLSEISTVSVETETLVKCSTSELPDNDSPTEATTDPVIDEPTAAPIKVEIESDVPATINITVPSVVAKSELPEASDTTAEIFVEPTAIPSEIATEPIPIMEASSDTLAKTEPALIMEVVPNPLETADTPKEVPFDPPAVANGATDVPSNIAPDLADPEATADLMITEETVVNSEDTLESISMVITASKSSETDTAANNSAEPAGIDNEIVHQSPAASDTPARLSSEIETFDAESKDINSNVTAEPVVSEAKVASNEVAAESVPIVETISEPSEISDTTAEVCCKPETLDAEVIETTYQIKSEPKIVSENTGTPCEVTAEPNAMEVEVTSEKPTSMETLTEVLTESAEKVAEPTGASNDIAIASVDTEAIVKCCTAELSAKDNPTEVLTETVAEVAQPTTTSNEEALVVEPVVLEATVTPNKIVVEPIPMVEAESDIPKDTTAPTETEPTEIVEVIPKSLEITEIPKEVSSDPASVGAEAIDVPSANIAPDLEETVATFHPVVTTETTVVDSEVALESVPIDPSNLEKSDTVTEDSAELAALETKAVDDNIEIAAESVPDLEVLLQSPATSDAPAKLYSEIEVVDAEEQDIKNNVTTEQVIPEPTVTPNEIAYEPIQTIEASSDAPKTSSLATKEISAEVPSDPPTVVAGATDVASNTAADLKDTEATAELVVTEPTVVSSEIALESVPLVEAASKLQEANVGVIDSFSEIKTESVIVSEDSVTPKEVSAESIPVVESETEASTKPAKESTAPATAAVGNEIGKCCASNLSAKDNATDAILEPIVIEKPTATPSVEAELGNIVSKSVPKEEVASEVPQTLDTVTEICSEPDAEHASDVATEPNHTVEVSSDVSPSNEPTEKATESTNTSEIAVEPVDTEAIVECIALPEPATVIAQPTASLNEVMTETTISPSQVPGEPIPKVKALSDVQQTSDIVAELVTTSVDIEATEMSAKDNPIVVISDLTEVKENPTASFSVETEQVISEIPIGPSDVTVEPVLNVEVACELSQTSDSVAVPKEEAASELSQTSDSVAVPKEEAASELSQISVTLAKTCSEPETVNAEVVDSANDIKTEPIMVSENTIIPSEVAAEPNATAEATSETPVSIETPTEFSAESAEKVDAPTETSSEIAAVSVDTSIAQPIATLNEVSAEPVIPETTITPSEVPKVEASSELPQISDTIEETSTEPEAEATAVIEATDTPIISTTTSLPPAMELEPSKSTDIVAELVTESETVVTQPTESPSEIEVEPIHTNVVSADLALSTVTELPESAERVIETIDINEVAAESISLVEAITEPPNSSDTPEETNSSIEVATEILSIVETSSELPKTVDTLIEATTETTALNAEATDTPIDVINDSLVTERTDQPSGVAAETSSLEADVIDTPTEITAESIPQTTSEALTVTTETSSKPALVEAKVTDTSDEVAVSEHSGTDIAPDKITEPEGVVTQKTESPTEGTSEAVAIMPTDITAEIISEKKIDSEQQGADGTLTEVSIEPAAIVVKATDIPSENASEPGFDEATDSLVKTITEPEELVTEDTIIEVIAEKVPIVDAAKVTNNLNEVSSDASTIIAETIDTLDIIAPEPIPTTKAATESLPSEDAAKEASVEPMTDAPTKVSAAAVILEVTVLQSEPEAAEIAEVTDIPSEIVVETDTTVESACKSPAITEKIDSPVELVNALDTASQQPAPPETVTSIPEATDPCGNGDNNASDSIANKIEIEDDAGLGKMTQKCLRRQPHVLDTTPSDDDKLAKPINLFATICKFYIKDKRLLATIEGRRRKTLAMYRYLSSFDEDDEIEYDFHPSQNNNDHQNVELVVESITNEHESLLEIPKNEYRMNESPLEIAQNTPLITDNTILVLDEAMPEIITDLSLEQSVFILDNLSEISFSFINTILFSDQISSDSSQSGESTATTTFETFDGDNEDESELTPTINNRTNNIVRDTNNLKPTNTSTCTIYTTNGILTNGSLRRSKKAKACAATLNGEHRDDEIKDDDVALMRRFVPGSIAERECKKWYNAVDMPNNPYAPEALKQRISGHLERCMDVPNISPSTEPNPLTLMTDNKGEVNAEQSREPDYTRYSRDYYINEAQQTSAKCQSPTESRKSLSIDQSEETISANNVINEAQNVNKTTNEPMQQPSQPTQEQESSIQDSSCIYKALPAQVVVVDEGSNNTSSLETISIQTTTSDDSETVRVYNFEKQETTILRGDSSAKKAKESDTTDTTSSSMESALSSPTKETSAKKRERPRSLQFSGAANTGSDSSSALGSPKINTRGSTPPAFKFLQPKRKLIEPSQVLSMDIDDEPVSTPSPEKVVIEHEVAHAMPSVKALAQAFLLTSKTSHAVRRWPTKPKKSTPETPTKLTIPTARKNLLESCVSVAEIADEATIASDLSSLETDPSMNLDSEQKESLTAINETQEEAAGKVSPVPVRAGFLRSNIAFFENLKFK